MAGEIRESDVLARYGGEEFLIIAPHTALSGAVVLAESARESIAAHDFSLSSDPGGVAGGGLTVSIGVASIDDVPEDRGALVRAADENLLRAKWEGRNRICDASRPETELSAAT